MVQGAGNAGELSWSPPALAATIANLPKPEGAVAILCSNFTCQPPITDPDELARALQQAILGK